MTSVVALVCLLGVPLAGAIALALTGHRRHAPELNIAFSLGTFLARALLTARVVAAGPLFALGREFTIDALNASSPGRRRSCSRPWAWHSPPCSSACSRWYSARPT